MGDASTSLDIVPIISAATALAAVIVSPLVSWILAKRQIDIAKHQISATNVSSKRQVWIDELRRDVAEALALASRIEELKWCGRGDLNPHDHRVNGFSYRLRLSPPPCKTGVCGLDYPLTVPASGAPAGLRPCPSSLYTFLPGAGLARDCRKSQV